MSFDPAWCSICLCIHSKICMVNASMVCVGHTEEKALLQVKGNDSGTDLVVMFLSYYSSIRKMVITEVVKVKSTD